MIKVDKCGLSEILGVKVSGLKTIERRGQLEDRLLCKGYSLVYKKIEGDDRKMMYTLDDAPVSVDFVEFNRLMDDLIQIDKSTGEVKPANIMKREEFGRYIQGRLLDNGDICITNEAIAIVANIAPSTVRKWDKIAVDNRLIRKDGYFYLKFEDGKYMEISKEEYTISWAKHYADYNIYKAKKDYEAGIIDLDALTNICRYAGRLEGVVEQICVRHRKYKVGDQNLVQEIYDSIVNSPLELTDEQKKLLRDSIDR